jgi:hypothetical protein
MNIELRTLIWYTRAEIVLTRKTTKTRANQNLKTDVCTDSMHDTHNEIDEILGGIVSTLDDTLTDGNYSWNTLSLAHTIQAFTLHLFFLEECRKATECSGCTLLSLDSSYTRLCCHIQTIIDVCKANLVVMCSSVVVRKARKDLPWTQTDPIRTNTGPIRTDTGLDTDPIPVKTPLQGVSRLTRSFSTLKMGSGSVKSMPELKRSSSSLSATFYESLRNPPASDTLTRHSRIRRNVSSKTLLDIHDRANNAMCGVMRCTSK